MSDIVHVVGTIAGASCGVADYTDKLVGALRARGLDADIHDADDWSLGGFKRSVAVLSRARIVHLQHPSASFQRRLLPYLLFSALTRQRKVLTLHEFSRKSRIGRALSRVMIRAAARIVVTNAEEAAAIARAFPFAAGKIEIVPIGNNMPVASDRARTIDVCHFGQIRAGKGIDRFLDVVETLAPGTTAALIGSVLAGDRDAALLVERARRAGVELVLDAAASVVADYLAASKVCLLPFPDGVSERRGSALAAMANGAIVVTTPPQREDQRALFAPVCLMGASRDELGRCVRAVLDGDADTQRIAAAARAFVDARSWDAIARAHEPLYAGEGGVA